MKQSLGDVLRRKMPAVVTPPVSLKEAAWVFARSNEQKVAIITTVLGGLFPGQDVKIRSRNRRNRGVMLGYWVWSMTALTHQYIDRKDIFSRAAGRDPKEYPKMIRHRSWRWVDVVKYYEKLTGKKVRDDDGHARTSHF